MGDKENKETKKSETMMLLGKGQWMLTSDLDRRWCCSGRGIVGGIAIPTEAKKKLEALKKELGEPPADLEWSYVKD